jgi:hypothetical protein
MRSIALLFLLTSTVRAEPTVREKRLRTAGAVLLAVGGAALVGGLASVGYATTREPLINREVGEVVGGSIASLSGALAVTTGGILVGFSYRR